MDFLFYTTKSPDSIKFVVGNVIDYLIEEKTGSKGIYHKVTLPQAAGAPFAKGQPGKFQQDPKIQFISFAASYTKDLIVAGKCDIKDFGFHFDRIYDKMMSKL